MKFQDNGLLKVRIIRTKRKNLNNQRRATKIKSMIH